MSLFVLVKITSRKHLLLLTNRAEADLCRTPVSVNSLNSTGRAKPFKMMDVIITPEADVCVCMRTLARVCACVMEKHLQNPTVFDLL